ncbi:polysaccharide deacetylase family protein [Microtetraspora malaysiensis]|uniref:polysaccharide deacetylase family protein n=1 Tax=Microtetraspora malaysiensis TaxID=161358 RepID=UPI003D89EB30
MPAIWMYHSVDHYTYDPYTLTVTPDNFESQIRWIYKQDKRGVTMRELLSADDRSGMIALTFDDGYADFMEHALPVLRRYDFTASLYIVSGLLSQYNKWDEPGPRKELMSADDLRHASDAGMEIASHGLTHTALTRLDDESLARELTHSREILREITGQPADGICYPYGFADGRVLDAVRAAGYAYGCVTVDPYRGQGPFAYTRSCVGDGYGSLRLRVAPAEKWLRTQLRRVRPVRAAGHIGAIPPLIDGIARLSDTLT